jgi:hypothetical protein
MQSKPKDNGLTSNITTDQLACLNQIKSEMRERLEKYPDFFTTWNLLRFCRARGFQIKRVRLMIENYLDFRDKMDVESMSKVDDSMFDIVRQYYAKGYFGYDYEGRLIIVDKLSITHPQKILSVLSNEAVLTCLVRYFMHIIHVIFPVLSKIHNRRVDRLFYIIDMKDVSVTKFFDSKVLAFLKLLSQMASDYFPELLDKIYIISAPILFRGIWNICKVWLDERTRDKIKIEGGPIFDKLSKFLNTDNLPVAVGGKSTQPFTLFEGPWGSEYLDAMKRGSYFLRDRSLEFEYFYTEDEKDAVAKRLNLNAEQISGVDFESNDPNFELGSIKDSSKLNFTVRDPERGSLKRIEFERSEFDEFGVEQDRKYHHNVQTSNFKIRKQ